MCLVLGSLIRTTELNCADMILSEVSAPTQHSVMYPKTQSEANVPLEEISVAPLFHKFATDNYSVSDRYLQVTENRTKQMASGDARDLWGQQIGTQSLRL